LPEQDDDPLAAGDTRDRAHIVRDGRLL
jgi:hypothetical protein